MISILLVDDEADILFTFTLALELAGYDVTGVTSGEEAIDVFDPTRHRAIVIDVGLPGIDGFETLERLRDDGRLTSVPFVVVSAHAGGDVAARGAALGALACLTKPCSVEEIRALIDHAVGGAD